jgi:hypothetical protein
LKTFRDETQLFQFFGSGGDGVGELNEGAHECDRRVEDRV